jgi:dCMP deaminase
VKHEDRSALGIAYRAASRSVDPRTQNGAYILNEINGSLQGIVGQNSPVEGVDVDWDSPHKSEYLHHAEEHAILGAAKRGLSTLGATLYVPWYCCLRCARAIVGAKIARVVGHKELMAFSLEANPKWTTTTMAGLKLLSDAGVECEWITGPVVAGPIIHAGKSWNPTLLEGTTDEP